MEQHIFEEALTAAAKFLPEANPNQKHRIEKFIKDAKIIACQNRQTIGLTLEQMQYVTEALPGRVVPFLRRISMAYKVIANACCIEEMMIELHTFYLINSRLLGERECRNVNAKDLKGIIEIVQKALENVRRHLPLLKIDKDVSICLDFLERIKVNYPEKTDDELYKALVKQAQNDNGTMTEAEADYFVGQVLMAITVQFREIAVEQDADKLIKILKQRLGQ